MRFPGDLGIDPESLPADHAEHEIEDDPCHGKHQRGPVRAKGQRPPTARGSPVQAKPRDRPDHAGDRARRADQQGGRCRMQQEPRGRPRDLAKDEESGEPECADAPCYGGAEGQEQAHIQSEMDKIEMEENMADRTEDKRQRLGLPGPGIGVGAGVQGERLDQPEIPCIRQKQA